jgi:NDP-mannose synthase
MRALLLAGGRGTRLLPYTTILPKPLVPVGEMPIMEILLRSLARDGVTEVVVSVGYLAGLIEAYFTDGSQLGVKICYQHERDPLGTAGPLRLLADWKPDESLLVLNGDLLTDLSFSRFVAQYEETYPAIQVGTFRRNEKIDLGVLDVDNRENILGYREKPTFSYDVSMGVYIVSGEVLQLIPPDQRFDMPQLVLAALDRGLTVRAYRHDGLWLDIGRPDDHGRALELVSKNPQRFEGLRKPR